MGLVLGLDGKIRAMEATTGRPVASISSTLYVGLLNSVPADLDGLDLITLISPSYGDEFSINPNFYTGRKAIQLSSISADKDGAVVENNNPLPIEWENKTGFDIQVSAFFITDVAAGASGNVLWVGTPDAGTATIANNSKATISAGDLILKVD